MYIFKIHGKEYKVRFTYRTVCEDDILDKISDATDFEGLNIGGMIAKVSKATAELLLVGLQKYHSDEFGYKDDKEKAQRLEEMLDLFDDYEDESTEEHEQSAATLFTDLQEELQKNGFLSAMMTAVEQTAKAQKVAEETKAEMEEQGGKSGRNEPYRERILNETLPYFLMLGVSEEKFWESIPIELEPYRKMDEMRQERLDSHMWLMGLYVTNAVGVAVSNALNGKKSKAKYLSEPILRTEKRESERTAIDDFNRFAAWAVVYNENFKSKNRQS